MVTEVVSVCVCMMEVVYVVCVCVCMTEVVSVVCMCIGVYACVVLNLQWGKIDPDLCFIYEIMEPSVVPAGILMEVYNV